MEGHGATSTKVQARRIVHVAASSLASPLYGTTGGSTFRFFASRFSSTTLAVADVRISYGLETIMLLYALTFVSTTVVGMVWFRVVDVVALLTVRRLGVFALARQHISTLRVTL